MVQALLGAVVCWRDVVGRAVGEVGVGFLSYGPEWDAGYRGDGLEGQELGMVAARTSRGRDNANG